MEQFLVKTEDREGGGQALHKEGENDFRSNGGMSGPARSIYRKVVKLAVPHYLFAPSPSQERPWTQNPKL